MTIDPSVFAALTLATPNAPQGTSVLLISTPPQMPQKIAGEVVNVDRSGQVVIQTDAGEIVIKTDLPLVVGQRVDIKMPPPQVNAAPIATLFPQNASAQRPENAPTVAQLHPAVVMDLAAPEDLPVLNGAGTGINPQIPVALSPSYLPAASIPPAQTLFQLIGLSLPATMIPPPATQAAMAMPQGAAQTLPNANSAWPPSPKNPLLPGAGVPASKPGVMPPVALERVQILFMGSEEEATAKLENFLRPVMDDGIPDTPVQGSRTGLAQPINMQNAGQNARAPMYPLLAQLTGLTPQKLPMFQVLQSPFTANSLVPEMRGEAIPQKSHIILHTPVLMTSMDQRLATNMSTVLLARMPMVPVPPETLFATQTLFSQTPLLAEMLQHPESFVSPDVAVAFRDIAPRPAAPQFAMQIIASLLGFSKAEPRAVFGQKFVDALKPEHAEQLGKELQKLPTLLREGAQPAEGMRFNFPVEMGSQYCMWQMTLRPPEYDQRQGQNGYQTEKPARFILDIYMSRMGPMQVDGLSYAKARKLDLIMRTKAALPEQARDALMAETMRVFDKADLKGSIAFQTY